MKLKYLLIIGIYLIFQSYSAQKTDEEYIAKYAKIAVEEMELYKIPASITLAQGLLETADGQSELAQNANNHFGIKCKKEWTGETYRYTDDAYMECFRKYNHPKDSYRDHSKFLAERPYYKALFNLDMRDYKGWAHGLKKAGYATNPRYAPLLISKIEKYKLNEFDYLTTDQVDSKLAQLYPTLNLTVVQTTLEPKETKAETPMEKMKEKMEKASVHNPKVKEAEEKILHAPKPRVHPIDRIEKHANKNMKYIRVNEGETLNKIASLYDMKMRDLVEYNDIENPNLIKVDEILFLQKKKNKGKTKYHKVVAGETLHSISQEEGIKLSKLLKRNRLNAGTSITVGQLLYLKGKKKK